MMDDECKPEVQNDYVDLPTEISPVHHTKIRVVLKKNSCNVNDLNAYFKDWIAKHFKFNIHMGWKFKTMGWKKGEMTQNNHKKDLN